MKAAIIFDDDFNTEQSERIERALDGFFADKGFEVGKYRMAAKELAYCMGCFGCWVKKPGECVITDRIAELNRAQMNSDVVVFATPVVFGQFSANIKCVIDRWLPNMLPFFETRPDGSTMHPPRYKDYPKQIMLGYGANVSEDDRDLFTDITDNHRSNVEVLFWNESEEELRARLNQIQCKRIGGSL